MDDFSILEERLRARNISYEGTFPGLVVKAQVPEGFDVSIEAWDNEYIVFYGESGWHEHFDNIQDAASCFVFGLSNECRLEIVERGRTLVKSTLQCKENNKWVSDSQVGRIFIPFWRRKTVRYLQNSCVPKKALDCSTG